MDFEALAQQLVRAIRAHRSQTAFSRWLGYKSNVVYTWEAGRRWPTASEFVRAGQKTLITEFASPDLREIKSGQLRKAIEAGDTFVENLVCRAAERVGAAIGSLMNIINPEVVALGGGMIEQLEGVMLPIIRAKALEYSDAGVNRGVVIAAAKLADDAGIIGAAAFARNQT